MIHLLIKSVAALIAALTFVPVVWGGGDTHYYPVSYDDYHYHHHEDYDYHYNDGFYDDYGHHDDDGFFDDDSHSHESQSSSDSSTDSHSTDSHSTDSHSTDSHSTDSHSTDSHSTDSHSTDSHSTDSHSTDSHSTDSTNSYDSSSDSSSDSHYDWFYQRCDSVAEIACGGSYSSLCKAIKKLGLYHELDDKHEHFTAFFPTDTAFDELFEDLKVDDFHDIETHTLEDVVLLHFNTGSNMYKDDLEHRCSDVLKMANGDYTRTICKNSKRDLYQKGSGNPDNDRPRIIESDKEACNGVVHTVNEVILPGHMAPKPKCRSITDIVCEHDLDILCEALIYTDLDDDLEEGSWTLFAPTDDAFKEMMERFHITDNMSELGKEKLTDILLYHVVASEELKFDELNCGEEIAMASGDHSKTICNHNNGHKFQKGKCNWVKDNNSPRITKEDVKACNGYIQIVDDVLLPEEYCRDR